MMNGKTRRVYLQGCLLEGMACMGGSEAARTHTFFPSLLICYKVYKQ